MKQKVLVALLLAALVCALWLSLSWRYAPQEAEQAARETDRRVERIEGATEAFSRSTEAHKTETKREVVVIRETVKKDLAALDPDGLADAALAEIGLFRGSAGSGAETGAAGVDGGK